MSTIASTLDFFDAHPVKDVANWVGDFLETGCDTVSLAMFYCRAASRYGTPVNLWINSVDPSVDRILLDRVLSIDPQGVDTVATMNEGRSYVKERFIDREFLVAETDGVFDLMLNYVAVDLSNRRAPGVLRISEEPPNRIGGATLQLQIADEERSLRGFDLYYATRIPQQSRAKSQLAGILDRLKTVSRDVRCYFLKRIVVSISASEKLAFTRLLYTVAAVREATETPTPTGFPLMVTLDDYNVTRELLQRLPLVGKDAGISPSSAEYGSALFRQIMETTYQYSIPDHSTFGHKVFNRQFASDALGVTYNTAKRFLEELEGLGIIESVVLTTSMNHKRVRGRGRQILFRFRPDCSPPFGVRNPYADLPDPGEIAEERNE